jgi:carbon-monoxide dehydrogenase large subunit
MGDFGIGASVRRKEDFRFLTGTGTYTDDINRPGQLHALLLRSPHAHAELGTIDTAAAKAAPGRSSPAPICKWAVFPAAGSSPRRTVSR